MKKKIINILCHTLANDHYLDYHVFGNWCGRQARAIVQYSDTYSAEAWYAVRNLAKKRVIKKQGVTYRLFPANTVSTLMESYFGLISTPELFRTLQKEDSKNTLIHFQGERGTILHQLLHRYKQYKTVLQYHGYGQPSWLDWLEFFFITPLEKKNFAHIKFFFAPIKPRRNYLIDTLKIKKELISFENNGVDFARFKPLDKPLLRKELNIPQNAFVMIYVGALTKIKVVDKIMKAYQILKSKYAHVYLLLVGGNKIDPLYTVARKNADKLITLRDQRHLPGLYNASNLYCYFGNSKTKKYAGPGVATTEALACNLNVISTNLFHFPEAIADRIGFTPINFGDFVEKIEYLIIHPEYSFHPRQIIEKYTSYKYTTKKALTVYDQIFKESL